MKHCTVAQSSMTYAMKVKQLLASHSIQSSVVRLNPSQTKNGCGFGVEFDCIHYDTVISLLKYSGITYSELSERQG